MEFQCGCWNSKYKLSARTHQLCWGGGRREYFIHLSTRMHMSLFGKTRGFSNANVPTGQQKKQLLVLSVQVLAAVTKWPTPINFTLNTYPHWSIACICDEKLNSRFSQLNQHLTYSRLLSFKITLFLYLLVLYFKWRATQVKPIANKGFPMSVTGHIQTWQSRLCRKYSSNPAWPNVQNRLFQ